MEEPSVKNSSWNQLVCTVADFGSEIKRKTTKVFERKLGRSNDENNSSTNLVNPHESLQRSYGSFLTIPTAPEKDFRRHRHSTPGSPYDKSYQQLQFIATEGNYNSPQTPSSSKFSIPIINVEQDYNFLTVDTYPGQTCSGRSSGFNSGPSSPSPTVGSSSFEFNNHDFQKPEKFTVLRCIKIGVLLLIFLGFSASITATVESDVDFKHITTSSVNPFSLPLKLSTTLTKFLPVLNILVKGAFAPKPYENFTSNRLYIDIEQSDDDGNVISLVTEKWELSTFSGRALGQIPESTLSHGFDLQNIDWRNGSYSVYFRTNSPDNFPLSVSVQLVTDVVENGAIFGGAVIVGLYILIVFELVNRTLSAMLAAAAAIGILSFFNQRPTTVEMVSWLDMETLILLFSMMVIVSILCETGFFDYCAYIMYKLASGQVWPLITGLCMFTAIVSAFLDNVTTILLMTPTTIRICETMELNPVPVLISIVIFSNIGGAVTPVGDPPNVIIANNPAVINAGIDFSQFSIHMLLGIIPVIIVAYIQLRITFRSMKSLQFSEPYEVAELRREIEVWLRAADSLSSYSKDESHVRALLVSKVVHLKNKLKAKIKMGGQSEECYKANLIELKASCKIRDWPLLIKCGIVLTVVILLFFLHSVPQLNLSLGWTALLGAVFLLILADRKELEGIFTRVEWSTLIFFSALFIVMEGVSKLGLLSWIGDQTEAVILNVNPESRLTVAILIILWVSGIASAFIDNIPFTTMMIQIVTRVASSVGLPLQPLVWALAFGTCLGGNGTLIGASANVVCAGLADQHGYRFTFTEYFRIGFPMMIVSLVVSTGYLMICHTLIGWNY